MEIVGAFACSHAGLIVTRRDLAPEAQRREIYSGFARMGEEIDALAPDALVVIGTDHGRIFKFEHVPQYTIGVGPSARSLGDAGLAVEEIPIHQRFARAVLDGMIEGGVDLAYSEAMLIDHSFVAPLSLAFASRRYPLVPIIANCNVPPLATFRRSYEVGRALGRAIRSGPAGRVVVIGTGGLSHWVGSPAYRDFMRDAPGTRLARQADYPLTLTDTGEINEEFDRLFLRSVCEGRALDFLRDWDTERVFREAGNGAQEVRNWLTVAGALDNAPAELIAYGAVAPWLTGTAVARFRVPAVH